MMDMLVQVICAGIATAAFSVLFQVRGQKILWAAVGGALGYFIYLLCLPMSAFLALLLASVFMALYAEVMARLFKTPATLYLIAGLIPIVPGGDLYQCILKALSDAPVEAANLGYMALLKAGAIAVGIIVVSSLIRFLPWGRAK